METEGDMVPETEADTEEDMVKEGVSDSVLRDPDFVGGGDRVPVSVRPLMVLEAESV